MKGTKKVSSMIPPTQIQSNSGLLSRLLQEASLPFPKVLHPYRQDHLLRRRLLLKKRLLKQLARTCLPDLDRPNLLDHPKSQLRR